MSRLGTASLTGLRTLLAPNDSTIGLAVLQATYLSLDAEIRTLSAPTHVDASSAAGGIEDVASNAAMEVERVGRMVDDLFYMIGMELMHAAQAVDLRRRDTGTLALGSGTGSLLEAYRKEVRFLDSDRTTTDDIQKSYEFLRRRYSPK